ncbi:hypothetical protein [Absidia glauca]|uniref:C2H2-type domain-containing protein n=1 Tax=Absidia glauca TaxID=4829 RepID=A0A168NE25_ABSGL|nr:hypothetical protein [Absidia glauca]
MSTSSSSLPHPSHSSSPALDNSPSSLSLLLNNTDDVERATSTSPVKRSWASLEASTDSAISKLPHLSPSRRTNTALANPTTTTATSATDITASQTTTTTTAADSPTTTSTFNVNVKTPMFTVKQQQQQQQQQQPMKEESSSQPYGSNGGTFTTFSLKQPLNKEESPLPAIRLPNSDATTSTIHTASNTSSGSIVKPYACNECEQSFCRPHNLKSHLATHSSIRPYKCGTCDKNFRRLHDLKRHEKLHTGEKPYVCDHCSRSFSRLDALNRHQRAENAARRWSDSDVSHQQHDQPSSGTPKSSSSPSSPSPPPPKSTPLSIPNYDSSNSDKKDTHISSDDTITHHSSKDDSFDMNGNDTLTTDSDSTTNTGTPTSTPTLTLTQTTEANSDTGTNGSSSNGSTNTGGRIKKKSIKSLVQGQQHRFRSSRPNIPQINIPNPATKWPPITTTLVNLKPVTTMSLSDITPLSPSRGGSSPANGLSSKITNARHIPSSVPSTICHESSLPTPETAHPLSATTNLTPAAQTTTTSTPWNHTSLSSLQKLPPPASLNQHPPPSRTVLPPVIRPSSQQDHHLTSPYSPFTPIASPLNPAPPSSSSHAALLQKNRDLEFRLASLEEEKTAQAETLNGVIHDLEVENRLLRSLVADSQRNATEYSFSRSQPTESPGAM